MPRYFIEVAYKGTRYSGFQVQQNADHYTVRSRKGIGCKFGQTFQLTGASRTDAGVHALQNYFHFDAETELFYTDGTNVMKRKDVKGMMYSLNSILPGDIVIKNDY